MQEVSIRERRQIIYCPCGQVLSVQMDDDSLEMKYRGRSITFIGTGTATITCDKCHRLKLVMLDKPDVVALA